MKDRGMCLKAGVVGKVTWRRSTLLTILKPLIKKSSTRSSLRNHVQISQKCCQVDILPHEQKLLNWCVHDYLVRQGFRISAITFSDECSEQVG